MNYDNVSIANIKEALCAFLDRKGGKVSFVHTFNRHPGYAGEIKQVEVSYRGIGKWDEAANSLRKNSYHALYAAFTKWVDQQPWCQLLSMKAMSAEDGLVTFELRFTGRTNNHHLLTHN